MRLVSAEQMRRLDRRTIESGVPSLKLMERAGGGIADRVHRSFATACRRGVLILAGTGNNGGDGFVIARRLAKRGYRVRVALLGSIERLTDDAAANLARWPRSRGRLLELPGDGASVRALLGELVERSGVVVDALFGTGLSRPVEGRAAAAIEAISEMPPGRRVPPVVVAVDLPSGLDADRGRPLGVAVRATVTYALGEAKLGSCLPAARQWVGELEVVDIGLAPEAYEAEGALAEASNASTMGALVGARAAEGHKGSHGHLLVVGGARGTSGAIVLAGRAALRSGVGLLSLACPSEVQGWVATALPEAMTLAHEGVQPSWWEGALEGKRAMVIGPGMGRAPEAQRLARWLLSRLDRPTVVDADGLNALAQGLEVLGHGRGPVVLTPHPGEMARLCGLSVPEVQEDRRAVALDLAGRTGAVVVLKGSGTLIAAPDGRLGVNTSGGPILGTAGTGDVLAGLLGGLLAQGMDAFDAARLAVFLHGSAGDRISGHRGDAGLLASELADEVPAARLALLGGVGLGTGPTG
jgi:hydroxyethylthiazole kinase-like uncharacterized protein yjeF